MKTFKEYITEERINLDIPSKRIKEIFSKSKFNLNQISRIGEFGGEFYCNLIFRFDTKKEAQTADINAIIKELKEFNFVLDKHSKDYKGGTLIESSDWRKDSPEDPHDLYIALTDVG